MAVRVFIEREIDPGNEIKLHNLLLKLRAKAIQARGYISGQTLRSVDDPNRFLVISTWNSLEEWRNWENDPDRKAIQEEIDKLLRVPSRVSVYVYE
ncbi:antibiotic biosynthesis monooxygenase family protein [Desulfoglaeba alkanexedens]|jgi:heme-degrading monooxygenase HmoA|uniref:Antibiotic biosynthesis monooxygenase n=1 Tax=Desulfoglaeba alkanexedens ALDC TaxID=980445 RepID=A0A4P8L897_9BACT|nr:antibiotic biosynthesis monooxygenase family protein [Desulfoglaeba alkanexedens]QCQ22852.1 antibiotic biosynthesis monooxygenase [Desulfoglaeba alkanexedens ALDC]